MPALATANTVPGMLIYLFTAALFTLIFTREVKVREMLLMKAVGG